MEQETDAILNHSPESRSIVGQQKVSFLNFDPNSTLSTEDKSTIYCSLVALVKAEYPFHQDLQDRAASFLTNITPSHEGNVIRYSNLATELVPSSDGSPDGFVESILTLLSSPHLSVVAPALSLLRILLSESPRVNLFYLLSSGLINKSFIIVRPHTLPISGNETIINDFIILLINTTHYASPYSIHSLDFAAEANIWYEREIIFQKVVLPSYQFVIFLISNRYILDGDLFSNFMDLLGRFKIICPFNRPTLEFLLASPIVIVLSSCHSFVEDKFVNGYILEAFQISLKIWNEHGRAVTQSGKRMIRSLIHEGFEDTFDQKLMNNPHDEDYYDIVEECVSILKLQGANVEYPENVAGGDNGDDAADENDDEQDFENNEEEEEDSENIDEETTGN